MLPRGVSASSRGLHFNTGNGPFLQPVDIGHPEYVGLVEPDTAFWALVRKDRLVGVLADESLLRKYRQKLDVLANEMKTLRFGLKPSAVYFNPTERCNLNCGYCYLPATMRRDGAHMSKPRLIEALSVLRDYFSKSLPGGIVPQIVFHGSEPLINREAVFAAIDAYKDDFRFGVQTNGTLLDDDALEFLTSRGISLGLSLDGHAEAIADSTRRNWAGDGVSRKVVSALEHLRGYHSYSVICTVTSANIQSLPDIVDFFHGLKVPVCMLNPVRCTQPGGRSLKPPDHEFTPHYLRALDRTYELYRQTGRKLIVANFANILVGILAPAGRQLMCDISPCGGGRCFFAVAATGDLFPCSEFIGLPEFRGGNLFHDDIDNVLDSPAFRQVIERKIEEIEPCSSCAVRHFCGSPCPAEVWAMRGAMDRPGAFCELYEEQARYALRQIADGKEGAYLWDEWDAGMSTTLDVSAP